MISSWRTGVARPIQARNSAVITVSEPFIEGPRLFAAPQSLHRYNATTRARLRRCAPPSSARFVAVEVRQRKGKTAASSFSWTRRVARSWHQKLGKHLGHRRLHRYGAPVRQEFLET